MFPIIDSHVHLWSSNDIPSLNWTVELRAIRCLNQDTSIREYRAAVPPSVSVSGFIYVETDRKSGLKDDEWDHVLEEVSYLASIANGADKDLILGLVPWAPVPAGPAALSRYMALVKNRCNGTAAFRKIKGVRYLLQDKPSGTMLQPDFIEGLNWLGQSSLTFDLGIDARSGGVHQLREACEMLQRLDTGSRCLKIIINHLCKPDLHLSMPEALGGHPNFTQWEECIESLARFPNTYMKLSGAFSELPPQEYGQPADIDDLVMQLRPWTEVVLKAFGPGRIMFGSDWPICNVGGPGPELSWNQWHNVVAAILEAQGLTDPEKTMVWSGSAKQAYGID